MISILFIQGKKMPTKSFKTKEEAKEWVIAKVKAMLNKKYNKSIGITLGITKWEDWNASIATTYTDDSMKKLKILVPKKNMRGK